MLFWKLKLTSLAAAASREENGQPGHRGREELIEIHFVPSESCERMVYFFKMN